MTTRKGTHGSFTCPDGSRCSLPGLASRCLLVGTELLQTFRCRCLEGTVSSFLLGKHLGERLGPPGRCHVKSQLSQGPRGQCGPLSAPVTGDGQERVRVLSGHMCTFPPEASACLHGGWGRNGIPQDPTPGPAALLRGGHTALCQFKVGVAQRPD